MPVWAYLASVFPLAQRPVALPCAAVVVVAAAGPVLGAAAPLAYAVE